jgi:hypothetical protein
MLELVTREDAIQQLRLDVDEDGNTPQDNWLAIWIPAVSESVASWVKDHWRLYEPVRGSDGKPILDDNGHPIPEYDESGEPKVHPIVRAAVLLELTSRFEGQSDDRVQPTEGHGYILSKTATALLTGLRKTTIA